MERERSKEYKIVKHKLKDKRKSKEFLNLAPGSSAYWQKRESVVV